MKNKSIPRVALFIVVVLYSLGAWQGVRQKNACRRAGYQTPIHYDGIAYCFGRDGKPEVVSQANLSQE